MRRRAVLAAIGTSVATLAGCAGGREPVDSSPTSHAGQRTAFRSALAQHAETVETVALAGTDWRVAYFVAACCGDSFAAHQAALARNFSSTSPENASLTATAYHECVTIQWRVPAPLVRKYRAGVIDTDTYVDRVQHTTTRESQC